MFRVNLEIGHAILSTHKTEMIFYRNQGCNSVQCWLSLVWRLAVRRIDLVEDWERGARDFLRPTSYSNGSPCNEGRE